MTRGLLVCLALGTALALMDAVSERFRGVNTRIAHTRRMRVPLPPVVREPDAPP